MSYNVIQPPFTLQFREMRKKELKAYFSWFLNSVPERIAELEREVKTCPGMSNWCADNSPASLLPHGEWFVRQVEIRRRTAEETDVIKAALLFPIPVPDKELTNKTFSLAVDIGCI